MLSLPVKIYSGRMNPGINGYVLRRMPQILHLVSVGVEPLRRVTSAIV
jgi:hypothetical protein